MSINSAISVARASGQIPAARPFGKDMANHSFLRAFLASATEQEIYFYAPPNGAAARYKDILPGLTDRMFNPQYLSLNEIQRLSEPGCLMHLDPHMARDAWDRRRVGQRSYSICSLIHTMAGPHNLEAYLETIVSPVQTWDALVCTSRAVRRTLEVMFERWGAYFADRFGATRLVLPQLPILPLGVDVDKFKPTEARRAADRAWRQKLGVAPNATVALYLGRLSYLEKTHPTPMFIALEQAARRSGKPFHLILAGWFPAPEHEAAIREAMAMYAPSVPLSIVDAREEPAKTEIWHAADVFTSLVDNIQETFGLAPIEGMAAGLPLVVTDWDGYRDTCRHGQDGIRIPTVMPPQGAGGLLPLAHGALNESFQRYVGNTALLTAFDIPKAAEAFAALANDEGLRRRMGESAQRRATETYDWPIVIAQYRALWQALSERRQKDSENAPRREGHAHDTRLDDPFRLYGHFATSQLKADTVVALPPEGDGLTVADIARSGINTGADRFLLRTDERLAIVRALGAGPTRIGTLVEGVPELRRAALYRWLSHAIKFDAIRVVDGEPGDPFTI